MFTAAANTNIHGHNDAEASMVVCWAATHSIH